MKKQIIAILSLCLSLVCACPAQSAEEPKPLWEIGLFSGAARIPHYRGSDEYNWYVLPLPYVIYRGEILQADREGLKGIFFKSKSFESSISLSGNPPVDGDNDARQGMPDLDAMFEIGPGLKWHITGDFLPQSDALFAQIALRAASSIAFDSGLDLSYLGLHADISLSYACQSLLKNQGIAFGGKISADFADKDLNAYFYDVDSKYARPDRHFYESDSGYAGFSLSGWMNKKLAPSLSLGFYSRWDNISGAVYEDSPLAKEKTVSPLAAH
ncbi:MAG: MipA/OmpV family protein [Desulfobacterales bacterium]